ncbi:hypothetical protein BXY82_0235 [Gelidibacter sediminis]|uniref:Uncharacterized protein n=1 Tax=Gelidibacter sediminis TaxID=1608710 RepID=A0A4V3F942_9FLAO|nr:hypothetical protein BXY82_0235 [Gelidibacter sediminis]
MKDNVDFRYINEVLEIVSDEEDEFKQKALVL